MLGADRARRRGSAQADFAAQPLGAVSTAGRPVRRACVARPYGNRRPRWPIAALALTCLLLVGCAGSAKGKAALPAHAREVSLLLTTPPATSVLEAPPGAGLPALDPPPSSGAAAVYLFNPDTRGVYVQRDADDERAQASTTKIMTALVAVSTLPPQTRITVGPDVVLPASFNASIAGLRVGDVLTLRDLLYALLLPSGDDAAIAIADGVAGSQSGFVQMMNAQAGLLGLTHTHFANVHGLDDPQQFSSARDLALLAARALDEPDIAAVVATPAFTLPATGDHAAYTFKNTNRLLTDLAYPGVIGVKTGFTDNAGHCLVFAAITPQGRLIGVVMGEPDDPARFVDAQSLLDWGFALELRLRASRYLERAG
jgi:serine-type D-Ala-D-Ala carboxypeptidase (penicillin-binding protein 5/6)